MLASNLWCGNSLQGGVSGPSLCPFTHTARLRRAAAYRGNGWVTFTGTVYTGLDHSFNTYQILIDCLLCVRIQEETGMVPALMGCKKGPRCPHHNPPGLSFPIYTVCVLQYFTSVFSVGPRPVETVPLMCLEEHLAQTRA